ncbi:COQ9 family protein [Cognatishimia activa]|uniref:RpsU-divergently transcribed protein n=1 Tax=Cognatishimia activa TaxID=1715691 RepID=A0A0P1IQX7_9RHOB|nr:COQ9 family protein [Cognatishimia activa]CUJ06638.1 rpsU-divergently transcribed protein [Cognatishimia activa]CUK26003.1 rpsU-divergently transcribed protein [Cognatishimia activa]
MSEDLKTKLMNAAVNHVAFDGWSQESFEAAIRDTDVNPVVAKAICPRGAVDLAVAYHKDGDARMVAALKDADLTEMRFRDRVAFAVKLRLQLCEDKEVVRRGTTLFALPQYAGTGSGLIWGTVDAIWTALGDSSEDINWYSKRATLSAVYAATVLYWLGDDSEDHKATWSFLDRRIDNVMQFEKAKAAFNKSPLGKIFAGPISAVSRVRPPEPATNMPGRWRS